MKTFFKNCETNSVAAKPTFSEGLFTVYYSGNSAFLSWPKPSGIFTRQTIQKQKIQNGRKKASNVCKGDIVEEEVPLHETSQATEIEPGEKYEFNLVLYDGDVVVQSLRDPKVVTKGPQGNKLIIIKPHSTHSPTREQVTTSNHYNLIV